MAPHYHARIVALTTFVDEHLYSATDDWKEPTRAEYKIMSDYMESLDCECGHYPCDSCWKVMVIWMETKQMPKKTFWDFYTKFNKFLERTCPCCNDNISDSE